MKYDSHKNSTKPAASVPPKGWAPCSCIDCDDLQLTPPTSYGSNSKLQFISQKSIDSSLYAVQLKAERAHRILFDPGTRRIRTSRQRRLKL